MPFKQYICSASLIGLCGFTSLCSAVDHYTLQPVPFSGFLNDKGQIAGTQSVVGNNGNSNTHAVLWENGTVTDLGALGTDINGYSQSSAVAINANGQVIGNSTVYDQHGNAKGQHAFIWSKGIMTDLGALGTDTDGIGNSSAVALNASGQVVGNSIVYNSNG
ncbi:MAG: hypothetical protein ABL903_17465 [Methylococcales bacterium]